MSDVALSRGKSLAVERFAAELAPVLGHEHALALVREGMRALGQRGELLPSDQQRAILAWLGGRDGLVAAAARHLLREFDRRGAQGAAEPPPPVPQRAEGPAQSDAERVPRSQLVDTIARAVGDERAHQLVDALCVSRGQFDDDLPVTAALDILETLSLEPGIVGVTARFAKARFALRSR